MQDYVKGPIIGEGTYGSVIRATHKQTGRAVAIKKVSQPPGALQHHGACSP
jgi:serine/threonine protein kinase